MRTIKIIVPILLFILFIGIASASVVSVFDPKQSFRYDVNARTGEVTVDIKNTGTTYETGIIELQWSDAPRSGTLAFISRQKTCGTAPSDLKNVHKEYVIAPNEEIEFTLKSSNIENGIYYPVLVHVDKCCLAGDCVARQPYGWGYALSDGAITFGSGQNGGGITLPGFGSTIPIVVVVIVALLGIFFIWRKK